ncbi:MAG: YhdP family protein [Rhodocyclaceae bacterium]
MTSVTPSVSPSRPRRFIAASRGLARISLIAFFVLGFALLALREVVLPGVDRFRSPLAAAIGEAIGQTVTIDRMSADWSGLRLRVHLHGVAVLDAEGREALRLDAVDGTFAWSSLARRQLHFHRLVVFSPQITMVRDHDGRLQVAGLTVDGGPGGGRLLAWLVAQRELAVRDGRLSWRDDKRGAPALELTSVDLRLGVVDGRMRLGLRAMPPPHLAGALDLRADLAAGPNGPDGAGIDAGGLSGRVFLALDGAEMGAWTTWVDYPLSLSGAGGLRIWADVTEGRAEAVSLRFAATDVIAQWRADLPPLALAEVEGRLDWHSVPGGQMLQGEGVRWRRTDGADGRAGGPVAFSLTLDDAVGGRGGQLRVDRLDVAALLGLAAHLPFDVAVRARLETMAPAGRLDGLDVAWRRDADGQLGWTLDTRLSDVSFRPDGLLPGIEGVSGVLNGNHEAGHFKVRARDATVDLPAVFPEPRLSVSRLDVEGGWRQENGQLRIIIDAGRFENPDAAGVLSGSYVPASGAAGWVDLDGRLSRADSEAVWRYLPLTVNTETRDWLRHALRGGFVAESRFRLKGDLDHFPFDEDGPGQFLVVTRFTGAQLRYANDWPEINGINGEIRFEGPGMSIAADSATILGVALSEVRAEVADLAAVGAQVMTIQGKAAGATADFLRFIAESPVSRYIGGFTDDLKAEGRGTLEVALTVPLHHTDQTSVKGEYRFADNRLRLSEDLPPLVGVAGRLRFTETDLSIPQASGRWFGEPFKLTARTVKGEGVRFAIDAGANVERLRERFDLAHWSALSGSLRWRGEFDLGLGRTAFRLESDLVGLASSLPAPLAKSASEAWPTAVSVQPPTEQAAGQLSIDLGGHVALAAVLEMRDGRVKVPRGGLGLNAAARMPASGLAVTARADELDIDAWRALDLGAATASSTAGAGGEGGSLPPLADVELEAGRLQVFGHQLHSVSLAAVADPEGWKGRLSSSAGEGVFDWRNAGAGALRARMSSLVLGETVDVPEEAGVARDLAADHPPRALPALDIVADRFVLRGAELGRLALQARNLDGLWVLEDLELINPDGRLLGNGRWLPGRIPLTELAFFLEAGDIGNLLERFGYVEAVGRGSATLAGRVSWRGAPTRIDFASLSGQFDLDARNGQFRQLEPGVGRLLGVLSLQSLPRRLTLDFRDVFSEGFAFDSISGSIGLRDGVLRTENLTIVGPAARVGISGSANVTAETQDLLAVVQPTLSESVAIGAAAGLINPVAGVVTYLAQKALSDPIERIFSYSYSITGSWTDPKVEKTGTATQSE